MSNTDSQITALLHAMRRGDEVARDRLMELVYDDLRVIAARRMARAPREVTFEPTALVHECFLRLAGRDGVEWSDRRHFFSVAARAMRDIVVEESRRRRAAKRGGGRPHMPLHDVEAEAEDRSEALLDLAEALGRLETTDPLAAEIALLNHFGGRSLKEIAELLELPQIRVRREWDFAKAFLLKELCDRSRT